MTTACQMPMAPRGDQVATLIDTGELDLRAVALAPLAAPPTVEIDVYAAFDDEDDDVRTELTDPNELTSQTKLRTLPEESAPPPHYVPEPPPPRATYSSLTNEHALPAPLPSAVARELTRRVRARTGRTPAFTPAIVPAWLPEPPVPGAPVAVAWLPAPPMPAAAPSPPPVVAVATKQRTGQRVRLRAIFPLPLMLIVLGVGGGVLAEHLQRGDTRSAFEATVHTAQGYLRAR